ncbi:MAG: zinc ribbon domain-containing protein [Planctomycetota bacterium]
MGNTSSGTKTPSRFFAFRWAYLLLAAVIWFTLISVLFLPYQGGRENWLRSVNLLVSTLSSEDDVSSLQLHSVFGMDLNDQNWVGLDTDSLISPLDIMSVIWLAVIILLVVGYTVPEAGQAKNLPATRGIHQRARIVAALVIGLGATALVAGVLNFLGLNDELIDFFHNQGWVSVSGFGWSGPDYAPSYGIAKPVSWTATYFGIFSFGLAAWLVFTFLPLGRDRYWQAERWTLIFSLVGLSLAISGLIGIAWNQDEFLDYDWMEVYLGGAYATWVVGISILAWAWTSRTIMFMMIRKYEEAAVNTETPTCFACGYDLRMLTSDRCPECGSPINPKLLTKIRQQDQLDQMATQAESRSTTR